MVGQVKAWDGKISSYVDYSGPHDGGIAGPLILPRRGCPGCGGVHDPDSPDSFVDFDGFRFRPPFFCMCCNEIICGRQFAYGRACGFCDTGACQSKEYLGHTPWRSIKEFADFVEAESLNEVMED